MGEFFIMKKLSITGLTTFFLGLLSQNCLADSISSSVNNGGDVNSIASKFDAAVNAILHSWAPILIVLAIIIAGFYLSFGHQQAKGKVINALVGAALVFGAIAVAGALSGIFK